MSRKPTTLREFRLGGLHSTCLHSACFDDHFLAGEQIFGRGLFSCLRRSDGQSMLDVTINDKVLHLNGVYAPNDRDERLDLFRRIEPFMITSDRVVSVDDWSAILDSDIDLIGDKKRFRDFIDKF